MSNKFIGQSVKRLEDKRFITGKGRYTDDIVLPGMLHAHFVRSPYAHARVVSVDTSEATAMTGVMAVYTGDDVADLNGVPCGWQVNFRNGETMREPKHPMLIATGDRTKHVGDPVAVVIAETKELAVDAAERVQVEWDELPAVASPADAMKADAPKVHDQYADNRAFDWTFGNPIEEVDAAISSSAHVTTLEFVNQRVV
ncbi:MAG: carbon monoxide dehydrogenase, partial [Spirosoma sp.]|nr:carbon monoxide dehydrogenase [Spirosoma sp.]